MVSWQEDDLENFSGRANITASFMKVKRDLEQHKTLILAINQSQLRLENSSSDNNKRMVDWIMHFEASINRLEKTVAALEQEVSRSIGSHSSSMTNQIDAIKLELGSSLESALAVQLAELEAFKRALKQELEVFTSDFKLKTAIAQAEVQSEPVINVNNANNVTSVMPEAHIGVNSVLSNSEKWLMGVLFNSEAPLSYSQISERTGKSISTARVYMNQLKSKGVVEESALPNGIKVFSLKHDAKVKKLYNV